MFIYIAGVSFLYTFFKQRKWQDGKEWPCLYSFTTKARRVSEDVCREGKEELVLSVLTMSPLISQHLHKQRC